MQAAATDPGGTLDRPGGGLAAQDKRDVCFIADVAVLPRWMRVSQVFDYVTGVHPRFDRSKAEGFLARTEI